MRLWVSCDYVHFPEISSSVSLELLLGPRRCPYVSPDNEESTRRASSKILPKLHAPIHHHVLELGIPQLADKQVRVKPTDNWEQLKLVCGWLEQERYEEIRPLALFGSAVVQYAMEGGPSSSTLYLERVVVCFSKTLR
jgi:hypothetical protein